MKRLIRANTNYNDIPTLQIEIDIYNLEMIRASAVYGADEEIDNLSDVIDKNGNIINADAYQKYLKFIQDIEDYISTLNVLNVSKHKSNKSASIYYSFENVILDDNHEPIFRFICTIRVSDHSHQSKKLRKYANTVQMDISESKDDTTKMYMYQIVTRNFTSYGDCLDVLEDTVESFERKVQKEQRRYFGRT